MSGCEFYADALVDLVEGRLEPERAARVEDHLETCGDCRGSVAVIRAVRAAPAPVPEDLVARIRTAVQMAPDEVEWSRPVETAPRRDARGWWRPWALPLAAAAALALWIGASQLMTPDTRTETTPEVEAVMDYDPYGAWPGSDGELAGDIVLSELSVEELEALLEEMES